MMSIRVRRIGQYACINKMHTWVEQLISSEIRAPDQQEIHHQEKGRGAKGASDASDAKDLNQLAAAIERPATHSGLRTPFASLN